MSPKVEWAKLAAVAVLGILLALAGWAIAGSIDVPPAVSPTTGLAVDSPPTLEPRPTTSTTRATVTQPASTRAAATFGGDLEISENVLDFGADRRELELSLSNLGTGTTSWTISTDDPSVAVEPSRGDISAEEIVALTVTIDRTIMAEGEFSGSFRVEWEDGSTPVAVTAVKAEPPIIQPPKANPQVVKVAAGAECVPTLTTISARVIDTSELEEVYVRWTGNGASITETAMSLVENDRYEGKIGPFTVSGVVSARVIAIDIFGNAGGASINVMVEACP